MYNVFFEVEPNKWVGVIPETVCQFSEITDKNGNSIFEHDLILIHESESSYQFTVEVLFHKGMFCYKNKAYKTSRDYQLLKKLLDEGKEIVCFTDFPIIIGFSVMFVKQEK